MLSKSRQFGEISVHHEFYRKVTTLMRKVNIQSGVSCNRFEACITRIIVLRVY